MSSSFVFVHDAFRHHFIDQGHSLSERGACSGRVSRFYGRVNAFDVGAHH